MKALSVMFPIRQSKKDTIRVFPNIVPMILVF